MKAKSVDSCSPKLSTQMAGNLERIISSKLRGPALLSLPINEIPLAISNILTLPSDPHERGLLEISDSCILGAVGPRWACHHQRDILSFR